MEASPEIGFGQFAEGSQIMDNRWDAGDRGRWQ